MGAVNLGLFVVTDHLFSRYRADTDVKLLKPKFTYISVTIIISVNGMHVFPLTDISVTVIVNGKNTVWTMATNKLYVIQFWPNFKTKSLTWNMLLLTLQNKVIQVRIKEY